MAFRFTEQHALALVAPHLFPGEQLVARARGVEKPWYSWLLLRAGALFWRNYLVVATNQRLLLLQHDGLLSGYGLRRVETAAWNEIEAVKLGWGVFNKTLEVRSPLTGGTRNVTFGRFWLANNFAGAEAIERAFRGNAKALVGGRSPLLAA